MNKRHLKLEKYGISSKRYKELCGFCEQYPEWKKSIDDGSNNSIMIKKCALIESTALEVDEYLAKFLIKSICYEVPINYLITCEDMPISQASFYDKRRYFFYLLDKNKEM